jgi:magnesium-transporting ATPase (P-type)
MNIIPKNFATRALLCVLAFIIVLAIVTAVVYHIFEKPDASAAPNLYSSLATALVINWMIVLVSYYIWAIQFYNVNFGWSIKAWERNSEAKKDSTDQKAKKEPESNPYNGQSLGLPAGTVRGTIAITLIVGSLAMMIASLGMDSRLRQNEFFVDNFEFFKTAFLMMIAFYFGNKSLEFLKDRKQVYGTGASPSGQSAAPPISTPAQGNAGTAKYLLNQTGLDQNNPDFESAEAKG